MKLFGKRCINVTDKTMSFVDTHDNIVTLFPSGIEIGVIACTQQRTVSGVPVVATAFEPTVEGLEIVKRLHKSHNGKLIILGTKAMAMAYRGLVYAPLDHLHWHIFYTTEMFFMPVLS